MKLVIVFVCALAFTQAQNSFVFTGYPPVQFFNDVILQSQAQKLLATPGFPLDLHQRVEEILTNSEEEIKNCDNTIPFWFTMRCLSLAVKKSSNQLKEIENEFNARLAAAAPPTA
ncbi:uncharacterized protein LOC119685011 [Teleopsis dalmanni]|uniref:uncharacterized protein LOC119684766 n=1 Tax=Teleopsis dalmanni TaxID=139649 RepID=UPI000D32D0CD|nr:uncharacterized protein LOC119684766 [Teleopsis dalmanni]XP_037955105.1 uncharacterized protein LOC119685011 [Teleopsis dalmanni]